MLARRGVRCACTLANPRPEQLQEKIVSLCKQRGLVSPGSEMYGGLANSYDYGPLGAQMKKNVRDIWWRDFIQARGLSSSSMEVDPGASSWLQMREDCVGFDSPIMLNRRVWEASKHTENFVDPLVDCASCHKRFRYVTLCLPRIRCDNTFKRRRHAVVSPSMPFRFGRAGWACAAVTSCHPQLGSPQRRIGHAHPVAIKTIARRGACQLPTPSPGGNTSAAMGPRSLLRRRAASICSSERRSALSTMARTKVDSCTELAHAARLAHGSGAPGTMLCSVVCQVLAARNGPGHLHSGEGSMHIATPPATDRHRPGDLVAAQ